MIHPAALCLMIIMNDTYTSTIIVIIGIISMQLPAVFSSMCLLCSLLNNMLLLVSSLLSLLLVAYYQYD